MTNDATRRPATSTRPTTDPIGSTTGNTTAAATSPVRAAALARAQEQGSTRPRGARAVGLLLALMLVTGGMLMAEPAAASDSAPHTGSTQPSDLATDPTDPQPDPEPTEPQPDPEPTEPQPDPEPDPTEPPTDPAPEPVADTDGDGLSDPDEALHGTDPARPDTDGDGLLDGEEVHRYATSPTLADTDGDWADDGFEVSVGTDPLDPDSVTRVTAHVRVVKTASATGEGTASASNRVRVHRGVARHRMVRQVKIRGHRQRISAVGRTPYFTSGSASTTERVTTTQRGTATVDASCTAPTYRQAYDCAEQNATRLATDQAQMTAHENAVRVAQDAAGRKAQAIATQRAFRAAEQAPVHQVRSRATKASRIEARKSLRAKIQERRKDHRG